MSIKEVVDDVKEIMKVAKDFVKNDNLPENSLLKVANIIAMSKLDKSAKALSEKIDDLMFTLGSNMVDEEELIGYS